MKFLFILALSTCCFASPLASEAADTSGHSKNFVSFSPISLIFGSLVLNYERVWGQHGAVVEGEYTLPFLGKGHAAYAAYRYHFSDRNISGFIGPYVKNGYASQEIEDAGTKYKFSLYYTSVGVTIGKRGFLWRKHNLLYALRFGLGYPVDSEIDWEKVRPEKLGGVEIKTYENILKINAVLDAEFTITFPF